MTLISFGKDESSRYIGLCQGPYHRRIVHLNFSDLYWEMLLGET